MRLLNVSFALEVVPMHWRGECIVPLYSNSNSEVLVC